VDRYSGRHTVKLGSRRRGVDRGDPARRLLRLANGIPLRLPPIGRPAPASAHPTHPTIAPSSTPP
jgi:hypothetical protein